jgi:hypothetical protein
MPTNKAADSFKSKLIERLRATSRGAPSPIGFGRVSEASVPAVLLLAVLPRNEVALAEAAVAAGADAVALRLCGAGTELLKETGDIATEEQAIKDTILAIGSRAIIGVIIGSNGSIVAAQMSQAGKWGVDFIAAYPHLTPADFLELTDVGRLAILDQQGGNAVRGINDLSIQAVLLRTERPHDSPAEMTVLDVAACRGAADGIHRPVVAFPSWQIVPGDLEVLKNAGIEGVALVGPEPDATAEAVEAAIRPYRDVVGRLGKPVGRRSALSEPSVILPRAVGITGDDDNGESDEDDE